MITVTPSMLKQARLDQGAMYCMPELESRETPEIVGIAKGLESSPTSKYSNYHELFERPLTDDVFRLRACYTILEERLGPEGALNQFGERLPRTFFEEIKTLFTGRMPKLG